MILVAVQYLQTLIHQLGIIKIYYFNAKMERMIFVTMEAYLEKLEKE
jgi:hypothetical protein